MAGPRESSGAAGVVESDGEVDGGVAGALAGARGLVSPTGPVAPKPDLAVLVAAALAAANDDGRAARRAA